MCDITAKSRIQILTALSLQLAQAQEFTAAATSVAHKALWAKRAEDIEIATREFNAAVYGPEVARVIS